MIGIEDLSEENPERHQLRVDGFRRVGRLSSYFFEQVGRQEIGERQPLLLPQRISNGIDLP